MFSRFSLFFGGFTLFLLPVTQTLGADLPNIEDQTTINVIFDGNGLHIGVQSPAVDIVGFNHSPVNDTEKQLVKQAITWLKQPELGFELPNGGCQLDFADVDSGLLNNASSIAYAGFSAEYRFECHSLGSLRYIKVNYFDQSPAIKTISVVVLRGQDKLDLSINDRNRLISW